LENALQEETTVQATENAELTDEQVTEFFENGGELPQEEKPQEEAKAEEQPQAEPEAEKEPEKEKFVPYGALHEERQKRKEMQQELERVRQESMQTSQVMQQVLRQLQQQNQPQIPSPDDDPVAFFQHKTQTLEQQVKQLTDYIQGNQQQTQEQQQVVQLDTAYRNTAAEFAQETPDFGDAYQHLITSRMAEYEAMGYSKQEAASYVQNEERNIAAKAFRDGENPAKRIYQLAQVRGYKKATPAPAAPTPEQKMQTLGKGVQASQVTGGAAQGGGITLEALAAAADDSPEEFNKLWTQFAKNAS
jgi:hypothetical protein